MALRNSALPVAEFRKLEASWWSLDLRRYTPPLAVGDLVQYQAVGVGRVVLCEVLASATAQTHSAVFKPNHGIALVRVLRIG